MKKAIFFTSSCGTDKGNEFESCRGEGRISINTAFGFSLLGYECYIVNNYNITSPKKIWENVYIINKPCNNEIYDIAFSWDIDHLKDKKNYKHKILTSYADTPNLSKIIKEQNLDIILTCNVPCQMHEPTHFNYQNTQYLPVIFPIPSINEKNNIGFLSYKFEPKLPELKVLLYHSSWEDTIARNQYYAHKQQLILDILNKKYKVNLYILVANEKSAEKCSLTYDLLKCNEINYVNNEKMRYDDIIKSILDVDLCLSVGAIFMPGPLVVDIISLGKPMIYVIEGFPSTTEFNNNCLCECIEHAIIGSETDVISNKKIETTLDNLEVSFNCYRKVIEDYDFKNWKKYTEDFLIKNCEYNNNDNIREINMKEINTTKNVFGDNIDWETHVREIVDTHKTEEIFYTKENEKINHLKKYKQNGKVLDCGCHIGRWIEVFRGNGYDYTGVDQSYEALETAKKYKPYGKFVHTLLWNMLFNNEFDIVHTNAVLQHNKLEEQEKILPKMHQALKPNGILIIAESTEPKQTSTQRTYQGWITFIEKHGFKFMESWHKNDLGFEDNYLFIKSEIPIINEKLESEFPIIIEKPNLNKNVTKEDLIQLLENKNSKQKISKQEISKQEILNDKNIASVHNIETTISREKKFNQPNFENRWNIFLTLQGNDEKTPSTSKDIITPLEDMRGRLIHYDIYNYFNLPECKKILVIGAGDGGEVKLLKEKGYDVIGTTLHWSDKKFAKNFYDVDLSIEDMHNMSFQHETFDGIYSFHSLEHTISPLIALFEIKRVLKKDGKLYITVPQSGTSNETGIQHYSVLTETLWKHLLDIIGFKDIQVYSESGNTIMKATKDDKKECPGRCFETEFKNLQSKPSILNYPKTTNISTMNCSKTTNISTMNCSNNKPSEPSDGHINMDKWWNSYLAIPNKVEHDGHGADYSNLNDTSSSGLAYYIEEFCTNVPLTKYKRILDIGAGNGGETRLLLDKGYRVTGITLGMDNVKMAKELYNVDILNMDMNHLDFLINSFDAVIMIQTFEHFLSPFIACIELWRVLKIDGLCYLDVPCPLDKPMWSINHTNLLYADQIINMFSMCGFEMVKQLSKKNEHRIRLIFKKLSIFKIRNWEQLRYIHQLRNEV